MQRELITDRIRLVVRLEVTFCLKLFLGKDNLRNENEEENSSDAE